VTRADVARFAGVSTAVVSYVVSGGRPVAQPTAARVREAIDILGYRPNGSARALRKGITETLGLILSDSSNPYFAEFAREIEIAASQRGYALMMANSHGDEVVETRLFDEFIGRRVDGLLVGTVGSRPDLYAIRRSGVPAVWIDCPEPVPGYASLGADSFAGASRAVSHLIQRHGHRRVGLVIGEAEQGPADARERGWRHALLNDGLVQGPIAHGPWTRQGGLAAGHELLAAPEPPTAIFASSDLQGIGVLRAAHERALRIPEDLAVVSFDGTTESEFCWPPLTTVRQPVCEMAHAAVEIVLNRPIAPSYRRFEADLLLRQSCGCGPESTDRLGSSKASGADQRTTATGHFA